MRDSVSRAAVGLIVLGTAGRPVRTKIRACTHDIADVRRDAGGRPYPFFRQRRILGSRIPHSAPPDRSEEHTSELQSLMRISYAVFCLKKKNTPSDNITITAKTTVKLTIN